MTDFGATGRFPEGKLREHDEGELRFGVAGDPKTGKVFIEFGKPVYSIGMNPDQAEELAQVLIKNAQKARG